MPLARPAFPRPACARCAGHSTCAEKGAARADYPACRRDVRPVPLARMRALADAWGGGDPIGAELLRRVFEQFARDRLDYSEIFEASVSWDEAGEHPFRFSYAYPGFRRDPLTAARALLRLAEPFGPAPFALFRKLVAQVNRPCVEQLLFGAARDAADSWRAKLYVQFREGTGAEALRLASALTGAPAIETGAPLHLLGIDVGRQGIVGAKFYFLRERVETGAPFDGRRVPLLEWLHQHGVGELRNVLAIHRLKAAGDPAVQAPAEIDFGLPENDLHWDMVKEAAPLRDVRGEADALETLGALFCLGIRRISVPVGSAGKLNVYYALNEVEAGA